MKDILQRNPFILRKGEKLMSIIISSKDEKMLYSLPCKNNNTINDIEKELYKEFPNILKLKIFFYIKEKWLINLKLFKKII